MAKPVTGAPPSHGPRHRLLLSTAMLGTLCLGYGRRVYADCAPSGPAGASACSGSTTTTQSLSPAPAAAPLVITTTPGFGVTTTTGDAFDLSTTAAGTGLGFTDAYVSTISVLANTANAAPSPIRSSAESNPA